MSLSLQTWDRWISRRDGWTEEKTKAEMVIISKKKKKEDDD